ncbi:MAG: hypothetical protein MJ005_03890, partial [Methanocorpusculum sp.]|nr:hypothetical protein [Methanocorpusculum sp.]
AEGTVFYYFVFSLNSVINSNSQVSANNKDGRHHFISSVTKICIVLDASNSWIRPPSTKYRPGLQKMESLK